MVVVEKENSMTVMIVNDSGSSGGSGQILFRMILVDDSYCSSS